MTLKEMEKEYILKVLEENNMNKLKSSKILGITPKTLYNKLNDYNLTHLINRGNNAKEGQVKENN
jgi:Nif-specific regulatory protein